MEEIIAKLSDNGDITNNTNKKKKQSQSVCQHPALMNNDTCAVCKKSVDKSEIPITLPFGYLVRYLFLTLDSIRRLRDIDLRQLLQNNKLHLVLDLDNTLIHTIDNYNITESSSVSSADDVYKILEGDTSVKLRPGARDFLTKASELFDLSIYTMAHKPYAKEIANLLESDTVRFSSVVSYEYSAKRYMKSLDIVLTHQWVTLVVDDLQRIWATHDRGNVVKIEPYTFFNNGVEGDDDRELERVWSILKNVHAKFFDKKNQKENYYASKNVRQLLLLR